MRHSLLPLLFSVLLLTPEKGLALTFDCVMESEQTGYQLKPNCQGIENLPGGRKIPFHTNSLGLRARDYSAKPSKGVLRILFLGPSSAVSFTNELGVAPALERSLNELARRDKAFRRKFKRIEIIPAAEAGFNLVHTYIRMPQLLEAYHPHLVMLTESYGGTALQQAFDHAMSIKDPKTGLAARLEPAQYFWPLPKSWEYKIWPWKHANELRVWVAGFRLAILKWRESLFGADESVYLRVHKQYLAAIKERAQESGASFVFLTQEDFSEALEAAYEKSLGLNSWYKPEWIAAKFAPWSHLRNEEGPALERWMAENFPVVNISLLFRAGRKPEHLQANDYHPTPQGARFLGELFAQEAFPTIKKILLEKRK